MGDKLQAVAGQGRSIRHRPRWLALVVVATLVTAVPLFFVGRRAISSYVEQQLVEQARAQGVILHLTAVKVSLGLIRIENAQAELEQVPGVTAAIASAQVTLSRFKPSRIQVTGVRVQAIGPPLELMRSLEAWRVRHATQLESAVPPQPEFENTQIIWRAAPDGPVFMQADDVALLSDSAVGAPKGRDWSVTAASARTGAYALKPLALALHYGTDDVEVGFGTAHMASAPVHCGWQRQPGADDFHVSFEELALGPLLASLNLPSVDRKMAAAPCKGAVSARVPAAEKSPYTGRFEFHLQGWVPPHPPELDGFAFGSGTTLESMVEVDRALTQVRLTGLGLSSGELKLVGHGLIKVIALTSAHLQAELKGQIPCSALASAMAESKLGKAYGQWVSRNAGRTVAGQVDVTVQIDADLSRLGQAKIAKHIGVGCGLRPMSASDLLSLGLPPPPDADFLQHAAENLPSLNAAMPSALPKLPALPAMPSVKWPKLRETK